MEKPVLVKEPNARNIAVGLFLRVSSGLWRIRSVEEVSGEGRNFKANCRLVPVEGPNLSPIPDEWDNAIVTGSSSCLKVDFYPSRKRILRRCALLRKQG
jgi:hypothetical protein